MGNCIKRLNSESYSLVENSDEIMHKIETNIESIGTLDKEIKLINSNNKENFELIQTDMENIMKCLKNIKQELNYRFSHQSSSIYGGFAPEGTENSLDGPSETMFSTSE